MLTPSEPHSDLVAIRRRRRQQRRCVRCGVPAPRATLCDRCRADWRYCPRCEAVYPVREMYPVRARPARASEYCVPCGRAVRNGTRTPRDQYLATMRQADHPQLAAIIRCYRRGLTYEQIAGRWEHRAWHYAQNSTAGYVGDAWVYAAPHAVLIDLDEPNGAEIAFLQLAAQAPDDVRALLAEIARLRALLDQCTPWIPFVKSELRAAIKHVLEDEDAEHPRQ